MGTDTGSTPLNRRDRLVFLLPLALFFSAVSFAAFWLLRNLWRR